MYIIFMEIKFMDFRFEFGINVDFFNIEIIELEEYWVLEDFLIILVVVYWKVGFY